MASDSRFRNWNPRPNPPKEVAVPLRSPQARDEHILIGLVESVGEVRVTGAIVALATTSRKLGQEWSQRPEV